MINAKAKESSDKDAASSVSSVTTVAAKASMESKKGALEKSKTSVGREAKQGDITTVGYCITCTGMSKEKGKLVI